MGGKAPPAAAPRAHCEVVADIPYPSLRNPMLLRALARAAVKYGGNLVGFGVAGDALIEIWEAWNRQSQDPRQKLAEVQQLAQQSPVDTRQLAQRFAQEVAADQPEAVRQAV